MTIDKAIQILDSMMNYRLHKTNEEQRKALKLGIEALKRVKDSRCPAPLIPDTPLPGETSQ